MFLPGRALLSWSFFLSKHNEDNIARYKGLIDSFLSLLRTVYPIKLVGLAEVKKQISYCKQIGVIYSRIFFRVSITRM